MATKNGLLEKELEAARKTTARLERALPEYKASEGTKRAETERSSTCSSGKRESPNSRGSPEVRTLTHKRGKGK